MTELDQELLNGALATGLGLSKWALEDAADWLAWQRRLRLKKLDEGQAPFPQCGNWMNAVRGSKDAVCTCCGFKDSCCY